MHQSSLDKMNYFVSTYLRDKRSCDLKIFDLGSANIGGTYKDFFNSEHWEYIGLDIDQGENINVVLSNPYNWRELESESADVFISGQTFEHIEFFWITIKEIARVLKPGGMCCIIAPSAGPIHRYPVDCWRFYPDGFAALAKYAGLDILEIIHDTGDQTYPDRSEKWRDLALIAQRKRHNPHINLETSINSGADLGNILKHIIKKGSRVLNIGSVCPKLDNLLEVGLHCQVQAIESVQLTQMKQHLAVYETIVAPDTLEYSNDPEATLSHASAALKEDGTLIVGAHNFSHASIVGALCLGVDPFPSVAGNSLTPKRYFTRQSACAMLQRHGFFPHRIDYILKAPHETLTGNTPGELPLAVEEYLMSRPEAIAYQFIISAKKYPTQEIRFETTDSLTASRQASRELTKKIQKLETELLLQKERLDLAAHGAEVFKQASASRFTQLLKEYERTKELAENRDKEIINAYEKIHNLQVEINNVNENPALYALKFIYSKIKHYIKKRIKNGKQNKH